MLPVVSSTNTTSTVPFCTVGTVCVGVTGGFGGVTPVALPRSVG